MKDYGKCLICGEPFGFGMDIVELRIQGCGQSQGYETFWQMGKTLYIHQECFKRTPQDELLKLTKS